MKIVLDTDDDMFPARARARARIEHLRRFSLDFSANQTDNYSIAIVDLIYSPSDMPKGLWRGFAFVGPTQRGVHAS
jgi:hypothetical protein